MSVAGSSGQPSTSSNTTSTDTSSATGVRSAPSLFLPPDALQNILRIANGGLRTQSGQSGALSLLYALPVLYTLLHVCWYTAGTKNECPVVLYGRVIVDVMFWCKQYSFTLI